MSENRSPESVATRLQSPESSEPETVQPAPVPPAPTESTAPSTVPVALVQPPVPAPVEAVPAEAVPAEPASADTPEEPSEAQPATLALVVDPAESPDWWPSPDPADRRGADAPAPPGASTAGRAVDPSLASLDARAVSAWFGERKVLDKVSITMEAGRVTALIGPSGCGKSTFLRILNRMHEMIPGASLAGEVMLDGHDIYGSTRRLTDARREIGMVFQKPNPFPAMSIYDNVVAGLRLTGRRASRSEKDDLVESSLIKAGLWREVRDRLRQPGGGLSGGQQQRLCIARSIAIQPRVLLMDEPCSALDPTSTRVIEETMSDLAKEVTIVIVTHNMQQAQRVSDNCAFFLAAQNQPGGIVEQGPTEDVFERPRDPRTADYVNGRFG